MLRDYPNYDYYINQVENEIRYPMSSADENIGGGRSSVKQESLTDILIRIEDDKRIRQMRKQQETISKCLANYYSPYINTICNELYFKKHQVLTLDGLADKLHVSRSVVSKHRMKLFESIAKELGYSIK